MASILRMPGISADSEEATILEWSVDVGASIQPGDPLAVVETEKANVDIESDQDGVFWRVLAEPGALITVGSPIAVLLGVGEDGTDESAIFAGLGITSAAGTPHDESRSSQHEALSGVPAAAGDYPGINVLGTIGVGQMGSNDQEDRVADEPDESPKPGIKTAHGGRTFATPLARRLARENNLSVQNMTGSGPGGRILRDDVQRAIAEVIAEPEEESPSSESSMTAGRQRPTPTASRFAGFTDIPHTGVRRAVASRLTASKREAPHFYLTATCRVDALLELRETINNAGTTRVSINDFFVKAVARTLHELPEMNVNWTDDAVRRFDSVDVAVAIASERGLVTPVLRSADTLTLTQVSTQIRDFAERARDGKLKQHELEGGAFTVTNLGMFGVESFSAIINPPQVGILAVGAVVKSPIVDADDTLRVGRTVTVSVSVDHRPVDGVLAARWLKRFKELIENPVTILA